MKFFNICESNNSPTKIIVEINLSSIEKEEHTLIRLNFEKALENAILNQLEDFQKIYYPATHVIYTPKKYFDSSFTILCEDKDCYNFFIKTLYFLNDISRDIYENTLSLSKKQKDMLPSLNKFISYSILNSILLNTNEHIKQKVKI